MNIVEHIWDALQRAIQKISSPLHTFIDLGIALWDSCGELPT